MNRFTFVAVLALAAVTSFVVGDLLDPDPVPVAQAVELSGVAPDPGPPAEGFFIVPPRVVDFRDQDDDSDDTGSASIPATHGDDEAAEPEDDDRGDVDDSEDDPDDDLDEGPEDSDDEVDDEDDSVDDD